jgi:Protein of unknown function (DUF1501)
MARRFDGPGGAGSTRTSRRAFVSSLLATVAAGCASRVGGTRITGPLGAPSARAGSRSPSAPRSLVQIYLPGGIDEMYGLNPKLHGAMRPGIEPLFEPGELVTAGARCFGPALRPLERFLPRMQVLRGVQSNTVAHEVGTIQTQQFRRGYISPRDELLLTRVGQEIAPDAPLHCLQLGRGEESLWAPTDGRCLTDDPGAPLLRALHAIAQSDERYEDSLAALAAAARQQPEHRDAFDLTRFVVERLRGKALPTSGFVAEAKDWPASFPLADAQRHEREVAVPFAWALFALEHDLAPTVFVTCNYNWDTHQDNREQAIITNHFAGHLAHFLTRLEAIQRDGRPLIEQVGIVISSELGRFPYINLRHGKDHFPQISLALMGPGLARTSFGETDDELIGSPIDLATGMADPKGRYMTLDDVGRTLLEWIGASDPEGYGYQGRVLPFCFA